MHHTTLLVLLLLVFGQFFVLGFAACVLWLAGEFGEPPSWRGLRRWHKAEASHPGRGPIVVRTDGIGRAETIATGSRDMAPEDKPTLRAAQIQAHRVGRRADARNREAQDQRAATATLWTARGIASHSLTGVTPMYSEDGGTPSLNGCSIASHIVQTPTAKSG